MNDYQKRQIIAKYLFKDPPNFRKKMPKILASKVGNIQADIMYLVSYGSFAVTYQYCLNVIDVYSRYAWSFPMEKLTKSRCKNDLLKVIQDIREIYPENEIILTTDKGVEFNEGLFDDLVDNLDNVKHIIVNPSEGKTRTSMIERFNRTLHQILSKERFINYEKGVKHDGMLVTRKMTKAKFVKILDGAVEIYNNRKHSSIRSLTPYQVFVEKMNPPIHDNSKAIQYKIPAGSAVLVKNRLSTYQKKSSSIRWNPKVWYVYGYKGWTYLLVDVNGEKYPEPNPKIQDLQVIKPEDLEAFMYDDDDDKPNYQKEVEEEIVKKSSKRKHTRAMKHIGFRLNDKGEMRYDY